jgi:nucleoside phosphorylase
LTALLGAGLAGALSADLDEGDVVFGREVRGAGKTVLRPDPDLAQRAERVADRSGVLVSSRGILWTAREKAEILAASGAKGHVAVDVESGPWARAADGAGVPFVALRVVLDTASEDLPEGLATAFRNGSLDRFAVAAHALGHPSFLGELFRLRKRTQSAMAKLADRIERFIALPEEAR